MRRVSPIGSPCESRAAITSFTLELAKIAFFAGCCATRVGDCGADFAVVGAAAGLACAVTAAGAAGFADMVLATGRWPTIAVTAPRGCGGAAEGVAARGAAAVRGAAGFWAGARGVAGAGAAARGAAGAACARFAGCCGAALTGGVETPRAGEDAFVGAGAAAGG